MSLSYSGEALESRIVLDSTVVFNEIMYHPADDTEVEWIELHNQMAVDMDLSGWRIDGGVSFDFPEGTVVPGQGYAVVASDPQALTDATELTQALGPFVGRLSNGGEELRLLNNIDSFVTRTQTVLPDRYWSVDLQGVGGVIANPNPPLMSGVDSNSGLGNIWNAAEVAGHQGTSRNPSFTNLVENNGGATNVAFAIHGTVSGWANRNGDALVDDYLFVNAGNADESATWELTGLMPGSTYELFAFGGVARDAAITVDSDGNQSLSNDTAINVSGTGFLFQRITAGPDGKILGSVEPGADGEANWSGFHLIEGTLDSEGQSKTVLSGNAGRRVMDLMDYSGRNPWPVAPDGSGASLAKSLPNLGSREAANWSSSYVVGGSPGGPNVVSHTTSLALNEISNLADGIQLELVNYGTTPEDLTGLTIETADDPSVQFVFPEESLAAGQFVSVGSADLGISASEDTQLILFSRDRTAVIDAVRTPETIQARMPDGTGRWLTPDQVTWGGPNRFELHDEIVINEVQYHAYPDRGTLDIPPEYDTSALLGIAGSWRYNMNLTSEGLPDNWAASTHSVDGDIWLQGSGLLGFTNRPDDLPIALGTDFGDLRNNDPGVTTFYFETDFEFAGDLDATGLQLNTMVDDGAVFYLNGVEVHRQNMPSGPVGPLTRATPAVRTVSFSGPISISTENLIVGTNRLSVEVHQSSPSSADAIFGTVVETRTQLTDTIPGQPFRENEEEWIELYNRSDATVDLSGWTLEGGIEFTFPNQTLIRPDEYLVVANDADALALKHPPISSQVVGSFSGTLGNGNDVVTLNDPIGNPADEVTYYDGGRWPSEADGDGSSLELRDADADNSIAESWAASDELARSQWKTYTYRGVATDDRLGNDIFHEFVLGLLGEGEVLLDDIRVTEDPDGRATAFLQNGDFQQDALGQIPAAWRLIGTHGDHGQSVVIADPADPTNQVLRLVATGPTEDKHNQASTTYADGEQLEVGTEYEISFRARWISGSNQVNTRLYFNFLQATTLIDVPQHSGTPGTTNSIVVSNTGPTYRELQHEPVVPDEAEAVTVSVMASDPDGIESMQLFYSVGGGDFQQASMTSVGDGRYSATIPPQSARSIVQFYVQGSDSLGTSSTYPAEGPQSRALYVVQDGQSRLGEVHNLRFVMTSDDSSFMYRNINRMSNHRLGATVIYDETEVFYNVGVRLKGSAFGRNNDAVAGLNIRFHPDQLFRGVHETLSIERASNRKELVAKHMLNRAAGGLTTFYDDVAHVITPRRRDTGVALFAMARTTDVYLDSLHDGGGSTPLYNLELLYSPTGTVGRDPEAPKLNFPYTHEDGRPQFEDLGGDKETYRWNFQLRNARGRDDYRPLVATAQAFSLSGQQLEDAVAELIDVDQWMRTFAMLSLNGNDDVYTRLWEHNFRTYVRPEDGKLLAVPWDLDRAFQLSTSASPWGITNNAGTRNNVANIIERPVYERLFWGHILDIANTTANAEYMERWTTHYGRLARQSFRAELTYIARRADVLLSRLPDEVPFEIITNGGKDLTISQRSTALQGRGWVNVQNIQLGDDMEPLDVTWLDAETWSLEIPLHLGVNEVQLTALDHQGQPVGLDSIGIESTVSNPVVESLRITEVNFNPYDATPSELGINATLDNDDFEFIEVQNVGSSVINVQSVRFEAGIEYTFPNLELQPGQFGVIVRDAAAFPIRYPGVNVIGQFERGGLKNSGERLQLAAGDGSVFIDMDFGDRDPWYERADGVGATLELMEPGDIASDEVGQFYHWRASAEFGGTPGKARRGANGVVINEVLSNTDAANTVDSIELFNRSDNSVDLSGWYLSDSANDLLKYEIPADTVLAPGQYLVFDERNFNSAPGDPKAFSLNGAKGDDVWLVVVNDSQEIVTFVDDVHFGPAASDESFGRPATAGSGLAPMSTVTLGSQNSAPRVGPVVITEVNYNPTVPSDAALAIDPTLSSGDLEFLEITSMLNDPADMAGWRIRGGVDYDFASDAILMSDSSWLIVRFNPADLGNASKLQAFRTHYGIDDSVVIVGGYSGQLSNETDRIQLQRPGPPPADEPSFVPGLYEDEITYTDRGTWPNSADGAGGSLQRTKIDGLGSDPSSWISATPTPGVIRGVNADFNGDGRVDDQDIDLMARGIQSGDLQYDITSDGVVDAGDIEFIVETVLSTTIGDSNLDGVFDSGDLVLVFRASEYEDDETANSTWRDGDWNGDLEFDTSDLVFAFQKGGYVAAVAAEAPLDDEILHDLAMVVSNDLPTKKKRLSDSTEKTKTVPHSSPAATRDRLFSDPQVATSLFDSDTLHLNVHDKLRRASAADQDGTFGDAI